MSFPKHPLTLALSVIVSSLAVSGCSSGGGGARTGRQGGQGQRTGAGG